MSSRAIATLFRPVARLATAQPALLRCACPRTLAHSFTSPTFSSPSPALVQYRGKKTKASNKKGKQVVEEEDEFDADAAPGKGKGGKKGKGKMLTEEELQDMQLPGEVFELKKLEERMAEAVDRLRVGLKQVVGRVGRVTPALLDNIRVDSPEGKRPLNEFAAVSVQGGKDLIVNCYEEAGVKPVTAALYASPLNLTPQPSGATTIRVPIPKPDNDKRQSLVRDAQNLCEKARIAVRQVRIDGQKEIKADVDGKIIGKEEGRTEGKKLDESTKKKTAEVDKIFEEAKKVLLDE
ncbi:hypothetical protein JCM11251_004098 [Rhodosporidiobolus azoricus]